MPIRFRCSNCNRLLGIARRKAGATVACPHCLQPVCVPEPGPDDDDDAIVPAAASARLPSPPTPAMAPAPPLPFDTPPPVPRSAPVPAAKTVAPVARIPASPPPPARPRIFEQSNIEEILRSEPDSPVLIPQPSAVAPAAAVPENVLVLSSSRATILSVLLALLLAIVFAAGVLVGRVIR